MLFNLLIKKIGLISSNKPNLDLVYLVTFWELANHGDLKLGKVASIKNLCYSVS